jgi:hypothetical protein
MIYLIFLIPFLFFAYIAPPPVTAAACLSIVLVTLVIKGVTRIVSGINPSFGEAFKAVILSFIFLMVAMFTLFSLSKGTGTSHFSGLSGWAVAGALLSAYVLGFKVSLGTSFGASAVIAVVSTAVSNVLLRWAEKML